MKIAPCKIVFDADEKVVIHEKLTDILDTGNVILGKHTKEFEAICAEYTNKKYAVALSNDTAALEITLRWLKKKLPPHKNEVIIPATSFFSCLIAIEDAGFKARIVDITVENGIHSTWEQISEVVNEKTACIMTVYCGGWVASDIEKIVEEAHKQGIYVLEDAAHCHGSRFDGKAVGSFGDAAGFSFYATKVLTTMEGGMLVTNDEELALYAKVVRNYGRVADFQRSLAMEWGNNWRMTELQCAIGVGQMQRADAIVADRNRVAGLYDAAIEKYVTNKLFTVMSKHEKMYCNHYRYILTLADNIDDKQFVKDELAKRGITLPGDTYEATINQQPIFSIGYGHLKFPVAEKYCRKHIGLPIYKHMTEEEVEFVVANLVEVVANAQL